GETIAITGATMTAADLTVPRVGAFVISFFGSAAFWWLYFSPTWDGETLLTRIDAQTIVARDVFTYGHLLLVAGILLAAVGDEFVLDHPLDALPVGEVLPVVLGPVIFLLALGMIAFRIEHTVPTRYLSGAVAMAAFGLAAWTLGWQAVLVSGLMLLVLAALVVLSIQGAAMNHGQEADAR
ncbi:MAG: low temperature requirement protein A, partial [Thermomicrobiales bacterium]